MRAKSNLSFLLALLWLCTNPAGAQPPAAISLSCASRSIVMGETVSVTASAAVGDKPAAGIEVWFYLNGRRWGAAARTGSDGRGAVLLPLPDPGRAQITAIQKPDMAAASYATWIWAKEVRDGQSVTLERTFTLAGTPRRAALFMTCDDSFSARINGASVLSGSNFQKVEFCHGP